MNQIFSGLLIYSFAIFSMLFWGLSFVWTKIAFETYGPFTVVAVRMLVSGGFLWAISYLPLWRESIQRTDVRWFLLLGFFEPFCYFMGESFGLLEVSASVGALVIATIPLFTTLLAPVLEKNQRVSPFAYFGATLSFLGVFLVIVDSNFDMQYSWHGIGYLFVAVAAAVGYNIVTRKLSSRYKPITIVKVQNSLGFLFFLPFFLFFEWHSFVTIVPSMRAVGSIVALTIFASTLAFLMYVFVLARIGMVRSNMFTNLIPIFASVFSWLVLNESFDARKIVGMACILAGVVLSQFRKPTLLLSMVEGG